MKGKNYKDIKRDSKGYPQLRQGTLGRTDFKGWGVTPQSGYWDVTGEGMTAAHGWQRSSLELVHTSQAAGNNSPDAGKPRLMRYTERAGSLCWSSVPVSALRAQARAAKSPRDCKLWGAWLGQSTTGCAHVYTHRRSVHARTDRLYSMSKKEQQPQPEKESNCSCVPPAPPTDQV